MLAAPILIPMKTFARPAPVPFLVSCAVTAGVVVLAVAFATPTFYVPLGLACAVLAVAASFVFRDISWEGYALMTVAGVGFLPLSAYAPHVLLPLMMAFSATGLLCGMGWVIRAGQVEVTAIGKSALLIFSMCVAAEWTNVLLLVIHRGSEVTRWWLPLVLVVPLWLSFCMGMFWRRPFIRQFARPDRIFPPEALSGRRRYSPARFAEERRRQAKHGSTPR